MALRKIVHFVTASSLVTAAFAQTPALAQATSPAPAAVAASPDCSTAAFAALVGADVTITSAGRVGGSAGACRVEGRIITSGEGAPEGSARFELNMPSNWNHKFLFLGGGGFDGNVPTASGEKLAAGYATLATDSGHVQDPRYLDGLDASWAVDANGKPAAASLADYSYRARHQVNAKIRPLVARFYGDMIERSYFVGCSGGGREALIEAERHPDDFDGFVSGDPITRSGTPLAGARNFRVLLAAPIPFAQFPAIEQATLADCDARDGVKDGLIQNPALCGFDPATLVRPGGLTAKQAKALKAYMSAAPDENGRFVGFGSPASGMGDMSLVLPQMTGGLSGLSAYMSDGMAPATGSWPWGALPAGPVNWMLYNGAVSAIGLAKPGLSVLDDSITRADGALRADVVDTVSANMAPMRVHPDQMGRFFASGKKLIIYHGFDDTILDPYSTIATYREMSATAGGLAKARTSARLFMVPGMGHCFGGSGPNAFDPLAAMERWVEKGQAPDSILAVRFKGNIPGPGKPIDRTMPLCPFPQQARYDGKGDVNVAASWSCASGDTSLLRSGANGKAAGISDTLAAFR